MTYDHELTLIKQDFENDSVGNQIPVEAKNNILCGKKSVTRAEFYNAAVTDLKPEIVLVIHGYEYAGEKEIEFENLGYRVIRTYGADFEELELVCERIGADSGQEGDEEVDGN
ncbi:phage head closure protein [Aminipila luticellarii]|uniref:Phage head-tail adapter protein n=1 Tax=Aminipila luticellarii TaxID=2507160 RepID=A0A410PWX2_9FIRM|nr:phage head closure protein [Aminipila luticellarii]QAT43443.1 phage head-tail adapter protein [Aminipila luticellarii]